jgi:adenylate kinase
MVALSLADKQNLFRIVVPRSLLLQSAQILQAKLGGLLNRDVLHVPFSRSTKISSDLLQVYYDLHTQIRNSNGVLLALPDHILSFKLSGLQQLCDGNIDLANRMIKVQDWLDKHARDVLDESDVSFHRQGNII